MTRLSRDLVSFSTVEISDPRFEVGGGRRRLVDLKDV